MSIDYYKHVQGNVWHINKRETVNKYTGGHNFRMYCGLAYYEKFDTFEVRGEDNIKNRRICKNCVGNMRRQNDNGN